MISLIITSPDKTTRHKFIQNHCKELAIHPLDITWVEKDATSKKKVLLEDTAIKQNTTSIGIEEIKNMQKKLFFKPIKSPIKAVILEDAHLLTTQAQGACLKILEEPPNHTIIILSADSRESFLPTIISRCKIIELKTETNKLTEKETQELTIFIQNLPKMTIGGKFKKAEQLSKNKEGTIDWLTNLILILREDLLGRHLAEATPRSGESLYGGSPLGGHYSYKTPAAAVIDMDTLKSFQTLHTLLKTTNVNPRFAIENTLLSLIS